MGNAHAHLFLRKLVSEWPYVLHFCSTEYDSLKWALSAISSRLDQQHSNGEYSVTYQVGSKLLNDQIRNTLQVQTEILGSDSEEALRQIKTDLISHFPSAPIVDLPRKV